VSKIRKMAKNYLPISDFATRPLNLRKNKKSPKFSKINILFLLKDANLNKGAPFQCAFCPSSIFVL
jgi:hypothetical protein